MEKQKKQLIILGVILVLAVAAFLVVGQIPEEDEETETVSYEVTAMDPDAVTKLTYTNENGTVTLIKEGDEWICQEDKTVDIDEDTVAGMIEKAANLTSENRMEQVEDISIYGLDEPDKKVLLSDGTNTSTLMIGDYNDTTYTYYLCLESDQSTVYTTTSVSISCFDNTLEDITAEEETTTEAETEEETVSADTE